MNDLIKTLQIFAKYTDNECYTAEHDIIYIWVHPDTVSDRDMEHLSNLDVCCPNGNCFIIYC